MDSSTGKASAALKSARKRASTGGSAGESVPASSMPVADEEKQQALAEAAKSSADPTHKPTLIDSDIETLYTGLHKQSGRRSPRSDTSDEGEYYGAAATQSRKMQREEAKVRVLNSNGRVDYSIQEGVFDISLLASIASHLSYWADEDVNHFMMGQMLKRGRENK